MYINESIPEKYTKIIQDIETTALIIKELKAIKSKYTQNTSKDYRFNAVVDALDASICTIQNMLIEFPILSLMGVKFAPHTDSEWVNTGIEALDGTDNDNLTDKCNE